MADSATRNAADDSHQSHPDQAVERVLERFRANGGRITAARRAIVRVLLGGHEHQHLTAEEVAVQVHADSPEIAVSTVYRSLDALEELNVVEHLHIGHGPTVYHLAGEHHLHLTCKQCGAVIELPERALDRLRTRVRRDYGFEIEPRHFAINGLCSDCLS